MNPAWWTRLCDAVTVRLRRTGRRVVVDLPVYAGWGPTGTPVAPEPRSDLGRYGRAMDQHRQHWPDDLGMRDMRYTDGTTHAEHLRGRATETMRETVDIMAKTSILLQHREHFETQARAAMKRHKADKAIVEFPDYLPGRYEIHVYKDGNRVASTLSEPIPDWRPAPVENARRYSKEGGTW